MNASRLTLSSPGSLVASIPHLTGFDPVDSLVAVWIDERGLVCLTERADLVPALRAPAKFTEPALRALAARGSTPAEVVLVTYGGLDPANGWTRSTLPTAIADVTDTLPDGIEVRDVLDVTGGRFRSLMCSDPVCCPPEGHPVEPELAVEFIGLGSAPAPARSAVIAECRPDGNMVPSYWTRGDVTEAERETWRDATLETIAAALAGGTRAPAAMLDGLADIRVRDTLLWDMTHADHTARQTFLDHVGEACRESHPDHAAPAATVYSITAWLGGDDVRARAGLDVATAANPDYGLAALVAMSMNGGLPPTAWAESMKTLPRDDCRYGDRNHAPVPEPATA